MRFALLFIHDDPHAWVAGMQAVRNVAHFEEGQHPTALIVGSGSITHSPDIAHVHGTPKN
jgi:hypothetical protein